MTVVKKSLTLAASRWKISLKRVFGMPEAEITENSEAENAGWK